MSQRLSLSLSPIGPWALMVLAAAAVVALTLWPYWRHIRSSTDPRRWAVVALRFIAVVLCLLAMLRPSLLVLQKVRKEAVILFLTDSSASMKITDEVNGTSRWDAARKVIPEASETLGKIEGLTLKPYLFDANLRPDLESESNKPEGQETAIGTVLSEALKREGNARVAAVVLISDGNNNNGPAPVSIAQNYVSLGVPIQTVGFGSAAAGAGSRDIAATGLNAPEAVFVKNEVDVRGTLRVRGFPNQVLDVELLVEGEALPVARAKVTVPESGEVVSVEGLKYTPQTAGEKLVTLRVAPKEGELNPTNNEFGSFITVLGGGLNVLHVQGPGTAWEGKYVTRALDRAREIQSRLKVLLRPARGETGGLPDDEFAPGKYDVYILGDVPAAYLTERQQQLLAQAVEQGAGLIMLGGRDSFGDGGWGRSPVARVLPTLMREGDGQIEPKEGLRVVPNLLGLDSYVLQLAGTPQDSLLVWQSLPPITGASHLGTPKPAIATVWAETPGREALMVSADIGRGRVLSFGGETWPWYRGEEPARAAHLKFWRQAILWAAHKEDSGESRVELKLDRRRLAIGQTLEATAVARDEKDAPIRSATYKATVTRAGGKAETMELFNQGEASRGTYYAGGEPGVYTVTVSASDGANEIGRASSRFLVYRDDRELDNPAANIALLQQLSEMTGGKFLRPEQLTAYFKDLDAEAYTQIESQVEYRVWDNWPFLLSFVSVLGLEWWLRKRMGWV